MFYIVWEMTQPRIADYELAVLLSLVALDDPYGASIRRELSTRLGRDYAITPDGDRALRAARATRERLWKGVADGAALA